MSIQRRILIPMISLTIGGGIAVLISSIFLFNKEINSAMYHKLDVAINVVESEIDNLKKRAQISALAMSSNLDLVDALLNEDRDKIASTAYTLKSMTSLDYCTILDRNGNVYIRTHNPDNYGDNIARAPHIREALAGKSETYIMYGATIRIGASAAAPIYDGKMNIVGAVSLGFMLSTQEFVYNIRDLTGCEVTVFLKDERVSSTLLNEDGSYVLGTKAPEHVSQKVLAGEVESYTDNLKLFGKDMLAKYIPLKGPDNVIIGMLVVSYFTASESKKNVLFMTNGMLITLFVFILCAIIARFISKVIEQQLESMNEKLKLQLTKMNLAAKAARIGLWDMKIVDDDFDSNKNIMHWSNELRNLLGFSNEQDFPNELLSWTNTVHPDDYERIHIALKEHLHDQTGKTPYDVECRLLKKSGEYAYFRDFGETIRDNNGHAVHVAGALMDITQAKENLAEIEKAHESMREARDIAQAANRSKTVFLANMSHEIRTPMNSIIGFSELAQDEELTPGTKEYLSNISENAKWLLNIINDLLDSSKIESGKMVLENIPFNLQDVISQCQSTILPKTLENQITLHCDAEPFNEKMLMGDPVRLRQVLMNLLSNAVKFTKTGGAVMLLTSVKNSNDNKVTLSFEVKDTGIGMSNEQISIIFEPFMQADDSVTRKFGGTGLGLSITKNIIELMGGKLSVESSLGIGSKFSFDLTLNSIDANSYMKTQKVFLKDIEKPEFKGEILVCEDNYLNQKLICEHLSRVGLKSVVASNGKEGIDAVIERLQSGEKIFDMIFMDICMPVMDGLDATTKILELGVKSPIIALTANIMANDLELYKAKGMTDCLGKPFTSQELWRCLIKYIP